MEKIEESKTYTNVPAPRTITRLLAAIIDAVVVTVASLLLCFGSLMIFTNTPYASSTDTKLKDQARICFKMLEESHLQEYTGTGEGDQRYSSSKTTTQMYEGVLASHIIHSFNTDNSYFVSKGITKLDFDETVLEANFITDNLAYFYYTYVKNNNDKYQLLDLSSKSYQEYHFNLFNKYKATLNENNLWILENVGDFPLLKGEFAYQAYSYLKLSSTSSSDKQIYTLLSKQYSSMLSDEGNILSSCSVYKTAYNQYSATYKQLAIISDGVSFLGFLISFVLAYVLPVIVTKKHYTLGKRFGHIYIVGIDDEDISISRHIARACLKVVPYFGFASITFLFLSAFSSTWTYPLFKLANIGISMATFNLIALAIAIISFIVTLANPKSCSIADLITKTREIDYLQYKEKLNQLNPPAQKEKDNNIVILDNEIVEKKEEIKN